MADIVKISTSSIDARSANRCVVVDELFAGEDLGKVDACYIGDDGKVYLSVSTQTTLSGVADFDGFPLRVVYSGQPVSLYGQGAIFDYASGMTPGTFLYVSDTAGKLSDTAIADADEPVAKVISGTEIRIIK